MGGNGVRPPTRKNDHMNNNEFVGVELSDAELASVQGGGFFGDVWDGIKKGANWVKNAAKDAYEWATGDGKGIVSAGVAIGTAIFAIERKY